MLRTGSSYEDAIYRELLRQADEKILHVSPPYSDPNARESWLHGYEQALKDLSRGWLEVPCPI